MNDRAVQGWVEQVYAATKRLDPTRPVCDNSGWEHVKTDIADLHDYAEKGDVFLAKWDRFAKAGYDNVHPGKAYFVQGRSYEGQPIVVSEYGGIGLRTDPAAVIGSQTRPWSYGNAEQDVEAYLARYRAITEAIRSLDEVWGFCYTQLTDVEHEVNGVMTYDRKPKFDPARLAEINLRPAASEAKERQLRP
jgi:hypothetical protein